MKVQWDVKFLPSGFEDKPENYRRALVKLAPSRSAALRYASEFSDDAKARIVKITRKSRPKVVAKLTFTAQFSDVSFEPTLRPLDKDRDRVRDWINTRMGKMGGKMLRCTYEELES